MTRPHSVGSTTNFVYKQKNKKIKILKHVSRRARLRCYTVPEQRARTAARRRYGKEWMTGIVCLIFNFRSQVIVISNLQVRREQSKAIFQSTLFFNVFADCGGFYFIFFFFFLFFFSSGDAQLNPPVAVPLLWAASAGAKFAVRASNVLVNFSLQADAINLASS
jgi:hypothetical protein